MARETRQSPIALASAKGRSNRTCATSTGSFRSKRGPRPPLTPSNWTCSERPFAIERPPSSPADRFTFGGRGGSVNYTKGVLCAAFRGIILGVVDMKKLLVVVVGLLGAILAGGASASW